MIADALKWFCCLTSPILSSYSSNSCILFRVAHAYMIEGNMACNVDTNTSPAEGFHTELKKNWFTCRSPSIRMHLLVFWGSFFFTFTWLCTFLSYRLESQGFKKRIDNLAYVLEQVLDRKRVQFLQICGNVERVGGSLRLPRHQKALVCGMYLAQKGQVSRSDEGVYMSAVVNSLCGR